MKDSARSVEAPAGIQLGVLLGVGSFGRVYKGEAKGIYGSDGRVGRRRDLGGDK